MKTMNSWKAYEQWSRQYEDAVKKLLPEQKQKILNMQSSNSLDNPDRLNSYNALDFLFKMDDFPKTSEDMILFRGGYLGPRERRPYISTSVFYDVAENYAGENATNILIVKKGSVCLPLRAVHPYAGSREGEVLIATKFVRRSFKKATFWYVPYQASASISLYELLFPQKWVEHNPSLKELE